MKERERERERGLVFIPVPKSGQMYWVQLKRQLQRASGTEGPPLVHLFEHSVAHQVWPLTGHQLQQSLQHFSEQTGASLDAATSSMTATNITNTITTFLIPLPSIALISSLPLYLFSHCYVISKTEAVRYLQDLSSSVNAHPIRLKR